ncbi:MAG TPA: hypothetical protein VNU66_02765, partial [Mycobacteriales bacterium]|nr:hypothetical protein [Mycobacteriales bacterium]
MIVTGEEKPRTGAAAVLCLVLLAGATALALAAGSPPVRLDLPAAAVAAALVPVYLLCGRITLDFEVRGESTSISPNQAVLALGVLAVAPPLHLAARLTAALAHAALERQRSVKALFNLAMAAGEV